MNSNFPYGPMAETLKFNQHKGGYFACGRDGTRYDITKQADGMWVLKNGYDGRVWTTGTIAECKRAARVKNMEPLRK